MELTSEKGNFQTWNTTHDGKDVIIRVNTQGDIVIIHNDEGGYLLHLHSQMDINSYMESVDGPAIHVYKPMSSK